LFGYYQPEKKTKQKNTQNTYKAKLGRFYHLKYCMDMSDQVQHHTPKTKGVYEKLTS